MANINEYWPNQYYWYPSTYPVYPQLPQPCPTCGHCPTCGKKGYTGPYCVTVSNHT